MPRSRFLIIAVLAASSLAACGIDWSLDPTADDFKGKGGGGATMTGGGNTGGSSTGGNTGGGGTGGAACVPEQCPAPPDECQVAACVNDECGAADAPDGTACGLDGMLQCAGGACQCTDAAECAPMECNDVDCLVGACQYTPNSTLTCGPDTTGSCSAAGVCGLCDDGVQNGAETGVDCGTDTQCGACPGDTCDDGANCKSGFCADGLCCDTACDGLCTGCTLALTGKADGTCAPLLLGTNDPDDNSCNNKGGCGAEPGYCLCEDGQMNGGETDADCGGPCGPTCKIGQMCTGNGSCDDGKHCFDGYCCNMDCNAKCGVCNSVATPGICSPTMTDVDGDCTLVQQCNGAFACKLEAGGVCSKDSDCATNHCVATVCAMCNVANNPCTGGKLCLAGHCWDTSLSDGLPCVVGGQCDSGYCADGVCCNAPCGGTCMACQMPYTGLANGQCAPVLQGFDPQGECPGPDKAATCSGDDPDANGDSSCGVN